MKINLLKTQGISSFKTPIKSAILGALLTLTSTSSLVAQTYNWMAPNGGVYAYGSNYSGTGTVGDVNFTIDAVYLDPGAGGIFFDGNLITESRIINPTDFSDHAKPIIPAWVDSGSSHSDYINYTYVRDDYSSNNLTYTLEFDSTISNSQILIGGVDRGSESVTLEFYNNGIKVSDLSSLSVDYLDDYRTDVGTGIYGADNSDVNGVYNGPVTIASSSLSSGTFTFTGNLDQDNPSTGPDEGGDGIYTAYDTTHWSVFAVNTPDDFAYDEYRIVLTTADSSAAGHTRDSFFFGMNTPIIVPEPSSALLLLIGSLGLIARRRRS